MGTELNSAELAKSITLELVDTYADTIKDNAGNVLVDFVSLAVTKDIK